MSFLQTFLMVFSIFVLFAALCYAVDQAWSAKKRKQAWAAAERSNVGYVPGPHAVVERFADSRPHVRPEPPLPWTQKGWHV